MKNTNFKIRINDRLDFIEYETDIRIPVIINNIIFDGFVFLIEFKSEDDNTFGTTEYPNKLFLRL